MPWDWASTPKGDYAKCISRVAAAGDSSFEEQQLPHQVGGLNARSAVAVLGKAHKLAAALATRGMVTQVMVEVCCMDFLGWICVHIYFKLRMWMKKNACACIGMVFIVQYHWISKIPIIGYVHMDTWVTTSPCRFLKATVAISSSLHDTRSHWIQGSEDLLVPKWKI